MDPQNDQNQTNNPLSDQQPVNESAGQPAQPQGPAEPTSQPQSNQPPQIEQTKAKSYGKRPLWQWLLIYLVVGAVVYFLIYFLFFRNNEGGLY